MTLKKSDDAVSPVIGVMLMLVITVVIGAVVAMFATGMVTETEAAPVAALDVKIYDYYQALDVAGGPDIQITHLSGDAIDTRDIELRFAWTHKGANGQDCTHYSTYSAEGFKATGKKVPSNGGDRNQALYVKTKVDLNNMRTDFGSINLDYYFGDVILTPGMKLTSTGDFLKQGPNTGSPFMNCLFNNYDVSTATGTVQVWSEGGPTLRSPDSQMCEVCYLYYLNCECEEGWRDVEVYTGGIMEHLKEGTAVNVMIIHIPSNKAIYDNTVVVQ